MTRVYNFSAGPACLPEWVLKKAASEMLDAHNSGMSVMEMSHRSSEFKDIMDTCKARLKRLMNIPDEYEILFLQGGASLHILVRIKFHIHQGCSLIFLVLLYKYP